jgi:bile acid:Na+ symporter, BASS family
MLESIYKVFVPAGLMVLMFGMGMQLVAADWARVVKYPLAVVVGLVGQFILLPAVAFLLVYSLSLPLAVAAGVVILAACPGGVVSNSISFLARGDIPLSVTLTAISSFLALLSVPLIVDIGLEFVQRGNSGVEEAGIVTLPLAATIKQMLLLVFMPLTIGMIVRRFASNFARRSDRWMRAAGVFVLLFLLIGSVAMEFRFFVDNLQSLWPVLLLLNLATLIGGYLLAMLARLDSRQRRTVAIEVGVQNVALGVMVAMNILQRPQWAVVPSVYSIVMMVTAFALILISTRSAAAPPATGPQ